MRASVPLLLVLGSLSLVSGQDSNRFEPNQTRRTAARIQPGDYKGLFCNAEDWYAIPLPKGERLEASARFTHADGDLDMELYDQRGRLLAWSRGSRDEEVLAWDAGGKATTAFLRVHNAANGYELHLGSEDSRWTGESLENVNCWGSDWYMIDVPQGEEIHASASFSHAAGDLDMELLDRDGNQLAVSSGREDQEELRWSGDDAKTVLLHVYHVHRARTDYSLALSLGARTEEDLAQVFREERPQGAGNDRMELLSGEVLRGRILAEEFELVTPYADLRLPASLVVGLDMGSLPGGVHELITVHGDRYSGFVRTGSVRFALEGLRDPLQIRRERVRRLVYGRRGSERHGATPPHNFVLRNGDRFHGELQGDEDWLLDLGFAQVPVPRRQVESLMFEADGTATVLRRDQTATRGTLTAEVIELRIEPVPGASASIALHPSAFSLIQLTTTEQVGRMRPAQLRHLIRRIAPEAPRDLVEAIATDADDLTERLTALRPLVVSAEKGNAELTRHVLALEDPDVGYGWIEVLLRLDAKLRRRLVAFLSEAHRPDGPRNAAAEMIVRLASESGQFQPLEQACGSPLAANMVMQAANSLGDQRVLEWLMNRVRRFRNTRHGKADADARRLLVEELPRLLEDR
jgi:hypothetical protein